MTDNQPTQTSGNALPGNLNVLTILTYIGCAFAFLASIWQFFTAKTNLEKMQETLNSGVLDNAPGFAKKMLNENTLEVARKSVENRVPLLIIGLAALALCLVGAMQMRKLKKQGYSLWLVGEILPVIGGLIFVGAGMFAGFGILGIVFVLLFIILYTTQRKYLIH